MPKKIHLVIINLFVVLCTINADEVVYVVKKGDTVFSIAKSFAVAIDKLMYDNNITDPQRLKIGQSLVIPSTSVLKALPDTVHRVAKGETLYGIARRYEISLQDLLDVNNLKNDYILKTGDSLRIPSKEKASPSLVISNSASDSRWPVSAKDIRYVTGKFSGVILLGERQESVKSITSGIVLSAGPYYGFGKVVIIEVAGGYTYVYSGLDNLSVKANDRVVSGTELGKLRDGDPQLLFLVYQNNTPIDPAKAPRA
ncbi:MAG: M23 family metallopeptidase [Spirochaetaceae bacterium]|jgi:murein DD-endopeptidase MepM/ murein hydrolase activator NlpD|nr:M23 family metallopeptidase [Spirochaetaceae bacterium]